METWNLGNTDPVYGLLIDGTMAQPCVDLSSMWSYGIDMKAISQEMLKISGVKRSLHHTDCSLFNLGTHYVRCYTTADCTYADYLLKVIIPPRNEVRGGYTGFTLFVCPSVCLSVRPSVRPWVGVRMITLMLFSGFNYFFLHISLGSRSCMGLNISVLPH